MDLEIGSDYAETSRIGDKSCILITHLKDTLRAGLLGQHMTESIAERNLWLKICRVVHIFQAVLLTRGEYSVLLCVRLIHI
jgi:hypothetical protein